MSKPVWSFDFETLRIGPGQIYPRAICLTWQKAGEPAEIIGNDNIDLLREKCLSLLQLGHILVGANTSYDLHVMRTTFPELTTAIRLKFAAKEIIDVQERERFINLATHGQLEMLPLPDGKFMQLRYDLASLSMKYLGKDRSAEKEDPNSWRQNYHLLDGQPADKYPPDARAYALEDSEDTLAIYFHQEDKRDTGAFTTEFFRAEAAFCLGEGTRNGLRTDAAAYEKVRARVEQDNSDDKFPALLASGILRPATPPLPYANGAKNKDGTPKMTTAKAASIDTKKLCEAVEAAYKERGEAAPRTDPSEKMPEGNVSRAAEHISEVMLGHPALLDYYRRLEDGKLVSTYLPMMLWGEKLSPTVHAPFKSLVSTGRTGSGGGGRGKSLYPAMNGQNIDPRVRPIFVPRNDNYFVSVDFKSLELVTTAQQTYSLFGFSVHRDKINAGFDLHAYLGAQLAAFLDGDLRPTLGPLSQDDRYAAFVATKGSDTYKFWRKFAKAPGLGFPGGMGAEKFVAYARKEPYEVDLRVESKKYLNLFEWNSSIHYYAKKMGLVEGKWKEPTVLRAGMVLADAATWPEHLQAIALAALLKKIWLDTYPEMIQYFEAVDTWKDETNSIDGDKKKLYYVTPMGMIRRGVDYSAASNGFAMQSPGSEGALLSWISYVWECIDESLGSVLYGSLPLLFIHDEIFGEIPIEHADACANRIKVLMEQGLTVICPDVKVQADPCIMERWSKEAEGVFDSNGKLLPWSPKKGWQSVI